MKYKLIIDQEKEESIVITAHKKNDMIVRIEEMINMNNHNIFGYYEDEIIMLDLNNIFAVFTKDSKVFVNIDKKDYLIKERLYQIEEILDNSFIKINQGCIVNIKKILRFENSITGSIKVVLKNGFEDYISRRELKNVKRRIGL